MGWGYLSFRSWKSSRWSISIKMRLNTTTSILATDFCSYRRSIDNNFCGYHVLALQVKPQINLRFQTFGPFECPAFNQTPPLFEPTQSWPACSGLFSHLQPCLQFLTEAPTGDFGRLYGCSSPTWPFSLSLGQQRVGFLLVFFVSSWTRG